MSHLSRIKERHGKIKARSKLLSSEFDIVLDRLKLAWTSSDSFSGSGTSIRRQRKAQIVYRGVQDDNPYLLLPFLLEVSPRMCSETNVMDEVDDLITTFAVEESQYRLSPRCGERLSKWALEHDLSADDRYLSLRASLFHQITSVKVTWHTLIAIMTPHLPPHLPVKIDFPWHNVSAPIVKVEGAILCGQLELSTEIAHPMLEELLRRPKASDGGTSE